MLQPGLERLLGPGDDSRMVLSQDLGLDYQFLSFILFPLPSHSQSFPTPWFTMEQATLHSFFSPTSLKKAYRPFYLLGSVRKKNAL